MHDYSPKSGTPQDEIEALKAEISNLKTAHQDRIETLEAEFESEIKDLQTTIDDLLAENRHMLATIKIATKGLPIPDITPLSHQVAILVGMLVAKGG